MLKIKNTTKFKSDFKKYKHKQAVVDEFNKVVVSLVNNQPLDEKYCDHNLSGSWVGYRECHVKPDVLLIYVINKTTLILERIGSHSELFRK